MVTGPPGKARSRGAGTEVRAALEVSIGEPGADIAGDLGHYCTFGITKDPGLDGKAGVPVPLGVILVYSQT